MEKEDAVEGAKHSAEQSRDILRYGGYRDCLVQLARLFVRPSMWSKFKDDKKNGSLLQLRVVLALLSSLSHSSIVLCSL